MVTNGRPALQQRSSTYIFPLHHDLAFAVRLRVCVELAVAIMSWFVTISVRIWSEDVVDFVEFGLCLRRVTAARCHELPGVLQLVGHLAAGVVEEAPGGEVQLCLDCRKTSEDEERSREVHGSCLEGAEGDGENFENRCRQALNAQQTRRFCSLFLM